MRLRKKRCPTDGAVGEARKLGDDLKERHFWSSRHFRKLGILRLGGQQREVLRYVWLLARIFGLFAYMAYQSLTEETRGSPLCLLACIDFFLHSEKHKHGRLVIHFVSCTLTTWLHSELISHHHT